MGGASPPFPFAPPAFGCRGRNFDSLVVLHKNQSKCLCKLPVVFFPKLGYNNTIKGKEKGNEKNLKNLLTNDNNDVIIIIEKEKKVEVK